MNISLFPPLNATLNGLSAILLVTAYVLIKRGQWRAHAYTMVTALVTSTIFLACYLTYHTLKARSGSPLTTFPHHPLRQFYLALLTSHTLLAIVILPLIGRTLWFVYKRNWPAHRKIARPTFWIWLYVSVTGVVVYWMLYQLAPRLVVQ